MVFILSFFRYGFKVGQYPWYFTLGCLVFSALCGVGLINYTEEKNAFRFNFSKKNGLAHLTQIWVLTQIWLLSQIASPESSWDKNHYCFTFWQNWANYKDVNHYSQTDERIWEESWDRFIVSWIKSNFFCWFTGFEQIVHVKLILFWFAVIAE